MDLPINTFKKRLLAGESLLGLWATIGDTSAVEALAGTGFDWVVLDTEHSPIEVSTVQGLLQAAAPYPTHCVVRPYINDTTLIKRHLDQGAQTLLLPYIESRAEAEAAVAATRYGPEGVRGVATTTRAGGYGRIEGYTAKANAEICVMLQVETARAMEQLEDIATVPGVDAIFIGPADLAASMGHPGETNHPDVRRAIFDAIDRLRALGKPIGIMATDPDFARRCLEAGTTFTAVGIDMQMLVRAADDLARAFGRAD